MQFRDVIGQTDLKERLISSVKEGRISHAQLFLGEEGTGNLSLALAYAHYIMCEDKQEYDSCGVCSACIKNKKLVHPDLHFVFPTANTEKVKGKPVSDVFIDEWREMVIGNNAYFSINQWQEKIETENKTLLIPAEESNEILKKLSLKTYESEYKIMIVWYPEKFNNSSANKLLKILEEPEPKTLFILVAHESEQLIPTILSRTQTFKVTKIKSNDLAKTIESEFQITSEQALNVSLLADGNYLEAKKLIESSDAEELFYSLFTDWMRAAFKADVLSLISFSDIIQKIGREKQKQFTKYCLHIFRESLINNFGSPSLNKRTPTESQFLLKFAPFIHGANCIEIIELFDDAYYHIDRNANPKILFLDVSFKLTKLLRVKAPVFE
ncbi:MAG: ATP-binding protein [Flavobacteriales bacterium]